MRARLLILIPAFAFVLVFTATLAYYELVQEEPAVRPKPEPAAASGSVIVALEENPGVRLHIVGLDGTGARRLTSGGASADEGLLVEAHPDWSPRAQRIVFMRYRLVDGNPDGPRIWTVDPDGSDLVQLTRGPWPDFLPAWSPDGTKIAFTREFRGSAEIFVMNADGSGVAPLTDNRDTHEEHPAWSPDGRRIAYRSAGRRSQDLYVMKADGSDPTRITNGPFEASDPAWSPDGSRIAFICDGDVCVVGSEPGSRPVQLVATAASEFSPRWSPDGKSIAFARDPGDLMRVDADGGEPVRVPLEGNGFTFSWGPA